MRCTSTSLQYKPVLHYTNMFITIFISKADQDLPCVLRLTQSCAMTFARHLDEIRVSQKLFFRVRDLNPGLSGESRVS